MKCSPPWHFSFARQSLVLGSGVAFYAHKRSKPWDSASAAGSGSGQGCTTKGGTTLRVLSESSASGVLLSTLEIP